MNRLESLFLDDIKSDLLISLLISLQLRRLNLMKIHDKKNPNIEIISLTALSNLIHLSIDIKHLKFDQFEIFIRKIKFQIKIFIYSM